MKSKKHVRFIKVVSAFPPIMILLIFSSCMINDKVAVRLDDIVAVTSGKTASQIETSIEDNLAKYNSDVSEGKYEAALIHLEAAVKSIEDAFYLAADKHGSWRSPSVFTARKLKDSEQVNISKELIELYWSCLHDLTRYSLVTMDIDGYSIWLRKTIKPNKTLYSHSFIESDIQRLHQIKEIFLFSMRASHNYFNEGLIDEAIKVNEIVKREIEIMASGSPSVWNSETEEQSFTIRSLYEAITYMLSTYYIYAGDLNKSEDVIKYLIGSSKDSRVQIRAFLTLSLIKDRFNESYYAKLYLDKALSILKSDNNAEHVVAFLETISPVVIEKYLDGSPWLLKLIREVVINNPRINEPPYNIFLLKRNINLNAAYIYRKDRLTSNMSACLAQFEDKHTQELSNINDSISLAEILVLEGNWQKIIELFWPEIDKYEYYRDKISRSRYASTAFKNVSGIFASLAHSIYSVDDKTIKRITNEWPSSLGEKSDNKSEIILKLIQLSKSRGMMTAFWGSKSLSERIPSKLRNEMEVLRGEEIQLLREIVAGKKTSGEIRSKKTSIYTKWISLRAEIDRHRISDPDPYIYTLDHKDIHFSPEEAIIGYSVTGETVLFYILGNDVFTLGALRTTYKELTSLIQEFHSMNKNPDSKDLDNISANLFAKLVEKDIINFRNIKTLYIAPDRILGILPFHVLFKESNNIFINSPHVVYTPSLSMLEFMKGYKKFHNSEVSALMGDPLPLELNKTLSYGDRSEDNFTVALRGLLIKKQIKQKPNKINYISFNSKNTGLQDAFARIPYTEVEIEEIEKLFNLKGYEAKVLLRDELTKSNVINMLSTKPRYIHFATHAIISHEIPYIMEPSLILSEGDKPIDHFLQSSEIEELDLRGVELVVLSACKTGIDLAYDNEGISGIAKSFLIAGAKNVLLTLWSIDDRATSQFMVKFYEGILKSNDIKEVLSETRKQFMELNDFSHPYYWGPFVLYGSG